MRIHPAALTPFCLVLLTGCYCFSNHQSARLLKPGQRELTPSFGKTSYTLENDRNDLGNQWGLEAALGTGPKMNLRARYSRFVFPEGDSDYNFFSLGPKFGGPGGQFALELPFGTFFGEGLDAGQSFQIQPTALLTIPLSSRTDLTEHLKLIWFPTEDNLLYSMGINSTIQLPRKDIRIVPGLAWLWDKDVDNLRYFSLSVAVSIQLPARQ